MKGYTGKILKIDLKNKQHEIISVEDKVYEQFLSGAGLGAWYAYNNIPAGADPLGEENILGFTSGLLTGTGSVLTGRFMVITKSPLTGGIGEANAGGYFSIAIKQCGYDAIFVHNKAETLTYLFINNNKVEYRDAKELCGLDATECEEKLLSECTVRGKLPAVATIGPAGEKLSLISGICTDRGRIAARSGVGAVMGSKNLKAIVLNGNKQIKSVNPEGIKLISKNLASAIRKINMPSFVNPGAFGLMKFMPPYTVPLNGMLSAMIMKKWGTSGTSTMCAVTGDAPIMNWAGSIKDFNSSKFKKIDGKNMIKRQIRKYHCYSCILGCGGECDISDLRGGKYKTTHRPEYETQWAFGGLILNDNLDALYNINEMLNRAGMDTISAAHLVAMAIECFENGIITLKDTNGLELGWGKHEEIIKFLELMIKREGIGDIFADGTYLAAKRLGKGAENYAIQAGKQECGMHDGRGDPPLAIHYCIDATPGRHTTGSSQYYSVAHLWKSISWAPPLGVTPKSREYEITKEEAAKAVAMGYYKRIVDATGACFFGILLGVENYKLFEWLNLATGWDKTPDEYMVTAARIYALRQLFNLKHGINPKDFRLHPRLAGEPPLERGPLKGKTLKIDEMMSNYWEFCGYDRLTGVPNEETLELLSLKELAGGR